MYQQRNYLEPTNFPEANGSSTEPLLAPNLPKQSGLVGDPITGADLDLASQELLPECANLSDDFNQLNLSDPLNSHEPAPNVPSQSIQYGALNNTEKKFTTLSCKKLIGIFSRHFRGLWEA
ncbi:hypothetical protein DSO57_1013161 [Entomophthora muscae]|uniref:Uncharacterized protein n=1 Tax=Entomophthora muscae TaxID=34485 RepID=A0ACC2UF42_9FUNG|nr:hypothetical protein DSO57_1013161 [Entomophthora muscae]